MDSSFNVKLILILSTLCISNIFGQDDFFEKILVDQTTDTLTDLIYSEDLNNDGFNEIIKVKLPDGLSIYENSNNIQFTQSYPWSDIEDVNTCAFHDVNNDGFLDIIYASRFSRIVQRINDGTGRFNEPEILLPGSNGIIDKISIINSKLENELNVIVSFQGRENLHQYRYNTNDGFNIEPIILEFESPWSFEILDFDNDGFQDILVRNGFNYVFLKNSNDLDFIHQDTFPTSSGVLLYFQDLDSDNFPDVIDRGGWYPNNGIGGIDEDNFNPFPEFPNGALRFLDIDFDGDMDIVRDVVFEDTPLFLFLNDGIGKFEEVQLTVDSFDINRWIVSDFDNNGSQDLIISEDRLENGDAPIIILLNRFKQINTISGCSYFDENENGLKDQNERPIKNILSRINTSDNYFAAQEDGCYSYFVEDGSYEITFQEDSNWLLSSDSTSYNVQIDRSIFQDLDFGFVPRNTFMAGTMFGVSGITRCNTDVKFDFTFQNQGTTIITEGIIWVFRDDLTELASTQYPIDTLLDERAFGFKFEGLYPGETITRTVHLSIPGLGGAIEPGTLIEIFSTTEAKNTQGFVNFFKSFYEEEIRCAYDPNDKLVYPKREEEENYTLFGDTLIYTVRFQNTGNDTAFNVLIRDTLDQNLDVSTFNIIHSSHRSVLRTDIQDGRNLTFNFENILLPDSTINFIGSQGYVTYSIQANDPIPENTPIENTASIYFDFNPPIVTNTALSTMVSCYPIEAEIINATISAGDNYELPDGTFVDQAGTYNVDIEDEEGCIIESFIVNLEVISKTLNLQLQNSISISPNPSNGVFILEIEADGILDYQAIITDSFGRKVKLVKIQNRTHAISTEDLSPGVFFLQVANQTGELLAVKKIVVMN